MPWRAHRRRSLGLPQEARRAVWYLKHRRAIPGGSDRGRLATEDPDDKTRLTRLFGFPLDSYAELHENLEDINYTRT